FKKFHKDIINELERKTEQDVKYMNATLKRYQTEHRIKLDSLEKSQSELKKLKRKTHGPKNVMKYEAKESECVETILSRQSDIQKFIADGCREALLEEKRRFCFLADKHCAFTYHISCYHDKAKEWLNLKLPRWQETCGDATKVPDTVLTMIEGVKTPGSTPVSGTPQPSPMMERNSKVSNMDYDYALRNTAKLPPAPPMKAHTSPLVDMFNNPSTPQKTFPERTNRLVGNADDSGLQRSTSVATGLNMMKKSKVITIFPHTAGSKTMLSFAEGDVITLLIPEERDGWLYGEHDISKMKGWFPSSYTKALEEQVQDHLSLPRCGPRTVPVRSVSTVNLVERGGSVVLPPPDYLESSSSTDTVHVQHTNKGLYSNNAVVKSPTPKESHNSESPPPH
uniref:BAR/IMD domain containing adaptor protein 2 like 1 n=1 Tax=Latimeria chalumnae TaxID=7897 RepID=H3AV64_LATCH